jgi:type I restriction enzyme S subunit
MKLKTFFEKFDLFANAPDALTKMRELAVDLAVKGRLTDRDTNREFVGSKYLDEPSSDALPANWRLLNFGKFCDIQGGNQPPKSQFSDEPRPGYVRMFQIRDLGERPVPVYISKESTNRFCREGEILIGRYGASVGKVFWAQDGAYNVALAKFIFPEDALLPEFAFWVLKSDFFQAEIAGASRSAQAGFNKGDLAAIDFPLPPLAEQKRIVMKVDELMALCDRLEAQQQERETRHAALTRASLVRFANAPVPANLDFVFHRSYDVGPVDLRKSIHTLAVQGKLVPQDSNDGNAREMIDRAMEERQRTIKTKSLRRKELDESTDLFGYEGMPSSWCIERLANLVDPENTISYGVLVPGNDVPDGIPFVRAQDLCLSNHPERPNKTIAPEIEKPYARTRLTGGEILLCVVGSIGKLGIAPDSWAGANIARAVARIKPIPEVLRDYLLLVLQENAVQDYFTSNTRTLAQPTLNVGLIEQTPIPIPPLAEQRRIVAKVNQLMTLVSELETQLTGSRAAAEKLTKAIVAELTKQA